MIIGKVIELIVDKIVDLIVLVMGMDRPQLYFNIDGYPNETPFEQRTDTSDSDFVLEIANVGKKIAILTDGISIYTQKGFRCKIGYLVCNCLLADDEKIIKPGEKMSHVLDMQDYDALKFHYAKTKNNCYKVIAEQIGDGKDLKGNLDTSIIAFDPMGRFEGIADETVV